MIGISLDERERERPSESDTQTASTMGGDPLSHEKENGPSVCKRKREQKRFDCVALCDRATKRRHPDRGTRFKKTVKNQRARLKKVRGDR